MQKMLRETLEMVDDHLEPKVSSPATKRLYEVSDESPQLSKEKSELFHSIVAKLLYMSKRSRPDIEPVIAFLCTRVSRSDEEDWKKLIRLLSFLKRTKNDARIIGATSLKRLYSWVDASYAVHMDMKGQTGSATSFGRGVIGSKSTKQKINTKSSTESELVGISEYLPYCIWFLYFLEHQGYKLEENVVFQDNKSAILMEKNGRNSCTGNSRHINIRYFFIKDRIKNKEVSVAYCPTEIMLADYFTKPLQGSLFNKFRAVIMGYTDISSVFPPDCLQSEERVGINKFDSAYCEKMSENVKISKNGDVSKNSKKISNIGKKKKKVSNCTHVQNSKGKSWSDVVRTESTNKVESQERNKVSSNVVLNKLVRRNVPDESE